MTFSTRAKTDKSNSGQFDLQSIESSVKQKRTKSSKKASSLAEHERNNSTPSTPGSYSSRDPKGQDGTLLSTASTARMTNKSDKSRSELLTPLQVDHEFPSEVSSEQGRVELSPSFSMKSALAVYAPKPNELEMVKKKIQLIGRAAASKYDSINKVFMFFGRSRQGKISKYEVRGFFKNWGFGEDDADACFKYMDANGDGQLDFSEFQRHFAPHIKGDNTQDMGNTYLWGPNKSKDRYVDTSTTQKIPNKGKEMDANLQKIVCQIGQNASMKHNTVNKVFRLIDYNHDNTISKEEVRKFFRDYGYPHVQIADKFFSHLDLNKNGVVDYLEFQSRFAPYIQPGHTGYMHKSEMDFYNQQTTYSQSFSAPFQS